MLIKSEKVVNDKLSYRLRKTPTYSFYYIFHISQQDLIFALFAPHSNYIIRIGTDHISSKLTLKCSAPLKFVTLILK